MRSPLLFAIVAGATSCSLTTSLDGFSTGGPDGGAPFLADATVEAADDAASADPCAEPSLIACFRFDSDVTGTPDRGATATAVDLVDSARGRAARFSPDRRSRIEIPATPEWTADAYTLEAWVMPERIPAAGARFGLVDSEARASMFLYGDGRVHCRSEEFDTLTPPVATGVFTHVACVFGPDGVSAYANGVLGDRRDTPYSPFGNAGRTHIGANVPDGDYFDGLLDDLRIHRVALDAQTIARHAR